MSNSYQCPEMLEYFKKAWMPSDIEDSYEIKDIIGEIPEDITGTLYRNGPSQKILPEQGYEALHLFDGDGLVHGFRIHQGRIHYCSQFVKNRSFLIEQEAGEVNQYLFGLEIDRPTRKVLMRQQHNTNVIHHGGRLLALAESAKPFEISTRTLKPIGEYSLEGRMITRAVSAHPKIDGKTGEMIIHGYQPMRPFLALYTIDATGNVTMAEPVDIPFASMFHDIAITENFIIVPIPPIKFAPRRFGPRGPMGAPAEWLQVQPDLPIQFAVRRREPGSPVTCFNAPHTGLILHTCNAYEKDDKLIMDACTYHEANKFLNTVANFRTRKPVSNIGAHPFVYELDLKTGRCQATQINDLNVEFPRVDERRIGYKNRYGYVVVADKTPGGPHENAIVKYDRQSGRFTKHSFGRATFPSEAIFVPRSADAGEDDGYVFTVVYDALQDMSYLAILNAGSIDNEPIAIAKVRDRVPMGFHGNFVDGLV